MIKPRTSAWVLCLAVGVVAFAPALAQARIEKHLKLESGGRFALRTFSGSVTLHGTAEPGAHVVITSTRDDVEKVVRFSFQENSGEVRIVAEKASLGLMLSRINLHYEVSVPCRTVLEIETDGGAISVASIEGGVKLGTSGGAIEIVDSKGDVWAHTSGGGISARDVEGNVRIGTSGGAIEASSVSGSLDAETSGGAIRVDGVGGDAKLSTSGGPIGARGVAGRLDATTSGGSIEAEFARGNAKGGDLKTSAGSIRVALDPKVDLDVEAGTTAGRIDTDIPLTVKGGILGSRVSGKLGAGGSLLRVHTSAGSIHITALP